MRKHQATRLHLEELEPRIPPATWVVTPPGNHTIVVEQPIPDAAIKGLVNAAQHANAHQLDSCWLVRFDKPEPG